MEKDDHYKTSEKYEICTSFENIGIDEGLLRGIYAYGFEKPSAIQQRGIKPILNGRDVILQSQSGTGKTCVFAVGALNCVNRNLNETQVIILSPTRELAEQTQKVCLALADYIHVTIYCCIGGKKMSDDIKALNNGVHVISGTPGRIYHMLNLRHLKCKYIKQLVIDEADEMLNKGFKEQVYDIYRFLSPNTQIILSSATLPQEVLEITNKFMHKPVKILVKRDELTLEGIKQFFVSIEKEQWKYETLADLYESLTITQAVVFCNTQMKVDWLTKKMLESNFTVCKMHAGMSQSERDDIMLKFRQCKFRVLISTDIWGRGLDVQEVSLVVNYDLPNSRESYIHRIGRSGRFGRKGVAINFVKNDDIKILRDIEQYYSTQIDEMPMNITELL
ncbi:putative eukaryotic initiation factor [Plasmodium gaboni]|uniref:RNA helicase n=14 Tax=Plasmodium (Laverania) TaxID=418107 RepID=Q8IFN9_PLAF7|nr:eukaryotic initiation factor 4A-III, putative [Plasmodium falciparum 3D7]XP_018643431.1 putative eukaryotic initiation factor [Plasmodium gaboni]XP_028536844.1 eukaryotic initiation factor, putative [Plasmodium sp. gorilla clade G2]ABK58711.1 eIF4A-like protein [Plasmodium falciparum]ETW20220.1 hypothetical protein PFFVO_00844 [Plasmodium falciparum Vietnam Oak-Knoll (FVO)]ETW27878.1 hypothetical protein PFFCH_04700 [Plasmodium falciparum FCH/4]ETW44713.1 hypothetical protein PFNF135_00925|eukprot:XP_001351530.1 eukaryotic initiation factor 4A-III, putative [Plasmodium falciparum 3D7]